MKRWRNFTHDSLLATEKVVEHAHILLHIAGSAFIYIITNFHMLYYFDLNACIVTTVSGVSNTLTRRATLRFQLVLI